MKITVIGAGAIGGWMAAKLARAGESVNVLARGETLAALQTKGITLIEGNTRFSASVNAAEDARELGVQDVVIVSVKAPSLASIAPKLAPLLGPDTMILSAMNGVPTWFFVREDRPLFGTRLTTIDRDGSIAYAFDPKRTIGCVVHAACSVDAPGVVRHTAGNRLIVGEARGGNSTRAVALAQTLSNAQFDLVLSNDIQYDIWFKLWGNMTAGPVSAITGATAEKIVDDELVTKFCIRIMREAQLIGSKIGIEIKESPESRHEITRKLGAFKTSMLQDAEAGRAIELDALVNVVREIGGRVGVETPNIDALLGITRLMAQQRGLYPK